MNWKLALRRRPTWTMIVLDLVGGIGLLTSAVLKATRYADQVASHGDELSTVFGAATGGLVIAAGLGLLLQRLVMADDVVELVSAPAA